MGKVSFAGGGDEEDYDYVVYIARDSNDTRCTGGPEKGMRRRLARETRWA